MRTHFIYKNYSIYFLFLILCITSSCKNEAHQNIEESIDVDSTTVTTDTATVAMDTTAVDTDGAGAIDTEATSSLPPPPTTAAPRADTTYTKPSITYSKVDKIEINSTTMGEKMGKIAFYCENEKMKEEGIFEMKEERSYEMIAMLNPIIENDQIKKEILEAINETRNENNQKPLTKNDITTKNVILGNYLRIQINDPYDRFIIKFISNDPSSYTKKIFDDASNKYIDENFEWRWTVTPKPNSKGKTKLELIISPLNKNKEIIKEKIKTYNININFKQSFFVSVWDKMNTNIEWAIASIIAPILIFLVRRFSKKKESEDS